MRKSGRKATCAAKEQDFQEVEPHYGCNRSSGHVVVILAAVPSEDQGLSH